MGRLAQIMAVAGASAAAIAGSAGRAEGSDRDLVLAVAAPPSAQGQSAQLVWLDIKNASRRTMLVCIGAVMYTVVTPELNESEGKGFPPNPCDDLDGYAMVRAGQSLSKAVAVVPEKARFDAQTTIRLVVTAHKRQWQLTGTAEEETLTWSGTLDGARATVARR